MRNEENKLSATVSDQDMKLPDRRVELIQKQNKGGLTVSERLELEELNAKADQEIHKILGPINERLSECASVNGYDGPRCDLCDHVYCAACDTWCCKCGDSKSTGEQRSITSNISDERARELTEHLLTNELGQMADRLILWHDKSQKQLGQLSFLAVASRLKAALSSCNTEIRQVLESPIDTWVDDEEIAPVVSQDCGQKRIVKNCPVCKGTGKIIAPLKRHRTVENTIMAQLLHKEGYSQRDIMRFLGYKSPRSVSLCLKRSPKQD